MSNPFSKLGYLAIGEEGSQGNAVVPDTFVELQSENVVVNYPVTPVTPIAGKRDTNIRPAKEKIEISGDVTILVEPKTIGEFLQNFAGAPSTETIEADKSYEHVWELANTNEKTYTFDIKPADADHITRIVGVKISQLAFSQTDNKIQCVISIIGQKAFTNARVTEALANGTGLKVDQTSGLNTSDVLRIIDKDTLALNDTASISSIGSELSITLGENATASVGDIIAIQKASSVIYTVSDNLILIGGTDFKMKAKNESGNPIDNVEENNLEDFSLNFLNDLEARYTADGCNLANRFPSSVKTKGFTVNGNIISMYTTSSRVDDMRTNEQVALRFDICGKQIDTNSAVASTLQFGDGDGEVLITASVASSTGSNLNIRIITNSEDTLAAEKTDNNILVKLADTTTASNTATLVAAVIDALSGVSASVSGAGTDIVVVASKVNLSGGRDANEKELLRFDLNNVIYDPYAPNISEDDIVVEDIPFNGYFDSTDSRTAKIVLRNSVASY